MAVIILMSLALVLVFGWLARTFVLQSAAELLFTPDIPEKADLIVVLGGDFWGPRVDRGAELLKQGKATRLLISGPLYGFPPRPESELAIEYLSKRGYDTAAISGLTHGARSTPEEVIEICEELGQRGAKRVLAVTDGYHTRRVQLSFLMICPGRQVQVIPARDQKLQTSGWWRRGRDFDLVMSEWMKIVGTIVVVPASWAARLIA